MGNYSAVSFIQISLGGFFVSDNGTINVLITSHLKPMPYNMLFGRRWYGNSERGKRERDVNVNLFSIRKGKLVSSR